MRIPSTGHGRTLSVLIVCIQLVVVAEALPSSTFHLGASDWKCPSWLDLVCDPVCLATHCAQPIETCMKDQARAWRPNPPCAIRGAVSPDLDGRQTCRGSFIGAMKCMSSHSKTNFTAQNDCMVIDKPDIQRHTHARHNRARSPVALL